MQYCKQYTWVVHRQRKFLMHCSIEGNKEQSGILFKEFKKNNISLSVESVRSQIVGQFIPDAGQWHGH